MNIGILKKYLKDRIKEYQEKEKLLNEKIKLNTSLDEVIESLQENITVISEDSLNALINMVSGDDFDILHLNEIKKLLPYWKLMDVEKQIIISNYINAFVKKVKEKQEENRNSYYQEKEIVLSQIQILEEYNALIDDNKIVRPIGKDKFALFIEFLNGLELNEKVKQQLIIEFYEYNIKFYEKEKQAKQNIIADEINTKASELAKALREPQEFEVTNISEILKQIKDNSTEPELEVIEKIIIIYNELKDSTEINNNELLKGFLTDAYEIQDHIDIWNLESDAKSAILTDLVLYLIPNYNKHKEEILNIFKEIIKVYITIKEEKISEKDSIELSEEDTLFIDESMRFVAKQNERFRDLSERDKNILESMNECILRGKSDEAKLISPKYSLLEVSLYANIKEYYSILFSLQEMVNKKDEYAAAIGLNDTKNTIDLYLNNLKELDAKIKEIVKGLQESLIKPTEESIGGKSKNIVIFPYAGIELIKDIKEASVENDYNETLPRLKATLEKMENYDANTLFADTEEIKPADKGPTDIGLQKLRKNNAPRRIRKGDIRVGFITVGVTPNNFEYLKENYGLDRNFRVYLVYTLLYKKGDRREYIKANTDFYNQASEISKILELFGNDFTDETLAEVQNIIGNSQDLINKVKNNDEELLKNGGGR